MSNRLRYVLAPNRVMDNDAARREFRTQIERMDDIRRSGGLPRAVPMRHRGEYSVPEDLAREKLDAKRKIKSNSPLVARDSTKRTRLGTQWHHNMENSTFTMDMNQITDHYKFVFPYFVDLVIFRGATDAIFSNMVNCRPSFSESDSPYTYDTMRLLSKKKILSSVLTRDILDKEVAPRHDLADGIERFAASTIPAGSKLHSHLSNKYEMSTLLFINLSLRIEGELPVNHDTTNHAVTVVMFRSTPAHVWQLTIMDPNHSEGYLWVISTNIEKYTKFLKPHLRSFMSFFDPNWSALRFPIVVGETVFFDKGLPVNDCADILVNGARGVCYMGVCVVIIYMFGCLMRRSRPTNGREALHGFLMSSHEILREPYGSHEPTRTMNTLMEMLERGEEDLHPFCKSREANSPISKYGFQTYSAAHAPDNMMIVLDVDELLGPDVEAPA